ncbi:MAG: phenylalanine--tRNA ligase subunit beta, partial [Acidimicrobiia bacterium]|nr:phenylalanine--tRNA ligase subunit beta [Acidimicrobiia bacterium]
MRAPLSWLKEFTPLPDDVGAITDALNQLGLEVEAVEEPGREINGVVIARVLGVHPHPDADKLRLVDIEFGVGETQVVCGAPNVVVGMVVAYAGSGATLPGGFTLEPRKIRGVVSDGMLCSSRELGLGEDHDGILDLSQELESGTDICEAMGLDDVVFDVSITPNRPDAMSIIGIARDLAAHFELDFTLPTPVTGAAGTGAQGVTVEVLDTQRCPRFTARRLSVTVGASPEWMQRRLSLAGMRPISNVVDITNYVLLERGQPLHAFDAGRLAGSTLRVRSAADGETVTTLDGLSRTLT